VTPLSGAARESIQGTLERAFGRASRIIGFEAVSGGSISRVARLDTSAGDVALLKWSGPDGLGAPPGIFSAEAEGLAAIRNTRVLRVPAVLGWTDPATDDSTTSPAPERWLLLEWLPPSSPGPSGWADLGARLARMHRSRRREYGWSRDNFIGSLPQGNGEFGRWSEFWRERRLSPQLARAYDAGYLDAAARDRFDALLATLDDRLAAAEDDGASLLHGDLWSGNVHFTNGDPALIDPSVYYGHREVDLAMAELFGGFPTKFLHAYAEEWPLLPGYESRRPIYQLYYLVVHVNLFGGGYVSSTLAALAEAGFR